MPKTVGECLEETSPSRNFGTPSPCRNVSKLFWPACKVTVLILSSFGLWPFAAAQESAEIASKSDETASSSVLSLTEIVKGAIGPFSVYSDGYGNPGATGLGYIAVVTLHTGQAPKELTVSGQHGQGLDGTVAFDRAEARGAYIGQINLIVASSFAGLNGAIWGYDVAKAVDVSRDEKMKLFDVSLSQRTVPVYSAEPLLDAGTRLFGTRENRKFPLLPGAHVIAAHKEISAPGPARLWCGVAIGVAAERSSEANVIMELCGEYKHTASGLPEEQYFRMVREKLAMSVLRVGENQQANYSKIFVGTARETVRPGFVGYAMITVPYIVLAREAVPPGGPEKLLEMTIFQWENAVANGAGPELRHPR